MTRKKFLDYAGLQNFLNRIKGLIPTKTSELQNDSGYITAQGTYDDELSLVSEQAVQNKVVTAAINGNQDTLSTAQANAADSGITSAKVQGYDSHISDTDIHVTQADKTSWDSKAAGTHTHIASDVSGLSTVATSGSYNDLSNKPNIPSKTSDLTNDSGFLTSHNPVDSALSSTSTNAVQNKVVKAELDNKANSADLSTVATTGNYTDLNNIPSNFTPASHTHGSITNDGKLGTASRALITDGNKKIAVSSVTSTELGYLSGVTSAVQDQLDGKAASTHSHTASEVSGLATVATSGSYNDLANKPTIPTVNNATLTIQKNGTTVKTFTANASSNVTANITVPTKVSELTNDSGYLTSASNLDSSKLTGTIDIARLPKGALERLVTVADQTARFALTTSDVQLGDTVKQLDTGVMYIVSDESKLSSADGYTEYTAGAATSVPWSGVTDKPSSYTPASHSHGNIANGGTLGTASRALITDGNKKITTSSVTSTELGYVSGVTSAIQTQLNGKAASSHTHTASEVSGLSTVATSGSYNDLSNKPTIPTVNNATLTIQKNGSTVKTFTANASSNVTANITVPTKTSDLTNDSHQTITVGTDTTSTASPAHSGTFTCIDSVTRDSNGHVTAVNTKTVTLPADNNTDTLVTQNVSTANENHPVLLTVTKDATSNQGAKTSIFASGVKVNPSTNTVTATTFSGALSGNASSATQFSANKSVTLTGDVTGTASSKAGWSVATTLSDSGVTAGTYGPSADVTGNNNATISVPEITVDSKGRVTSVANRTLTCKNNTYNVYNKTLTIQKNGTNVATFTSNSNTDVTANIVVPTKTSELTNDSGFLTSHQSLSNYVTLDTKQTISAVKTISAADLKFSTTETRGTAPSADISKEITTLDSAGNGISKIGAYYYTDKHSETRIYAYKTTVATGGNIGYLGIGCNTSGNVYTFAPTPATSDNSTQIATTAFVKAQGYLTSHQSLANYSTLANTVKSLSISGKTITVTPGSGSAYTLTTQDTTYSNFVKSGSGAKAGLVPAPSTTAGTTKYLREDGTWQVPPDHTYTVNNATLTIQKNGTNVATFTSNASSNATANITVPTKTSELTNDSGFLTSHQSLSNYVTLNSAQTITATKTFSAAQPNMVFSMSGLTKTTNPSSQVWGNIFFQDKTTGTSATKRAGSLDCGVNASGQTEISMRAFNWGAVDNTNAGIGVCYPRDGTAYTYAPTPANLDNSTQIATTAFVYNNAAKHFYAATNIYVAKAATGNGSGSNTSNYMSLADLRTFLATAHMHSSASDLNGAYNLQLLFKAGDSFGNATFDATKIPGVRNLILNTSTGTNSTVDNYSTNSPTFGNIVVTGDISVTMRNLNCTGRISSQYGAYVAIDTYMGISSLQATNNGYLNVAKNMVINVCDAHTDYLFSAANNGILAMWPGATVTINFRQQCYYTRCLFMSASNGTAWIGYSSFKLTGTEPMAVWGGSGTLTGTSETAAATVEKAVTLASGQTFTLTKNATAKVKFTIDNTAANPTLNIGGTGAKPIYWNNAAVPAAMLMKNIAYDVKYNGSQFVIQNAVKRLTNNDFGVFRSTGNYNQTYNSGSWNFTGWNVAYGTGIENSNWRGSHIGNIQQNVTSNNNTFPILFSGTANATDNTSTAPYFGTGIKVNPSTSIISASGFSGSPPATTYVAAVADGGALVNSQTTSFGAVWRAPTKNYQVAGATFPNNNDTVYICYSVTNANVTAGTNTVAKQLTWAADTGTLTANAFSGALTGNVTGNCSGSSGSCTGNAATATQFSANKSVTLTGDVTGTASSKAGWSVATTLANSGVTAGTYGPSADVTGNNNATISVPQITVDAKGRVTSVVNKTLTCKNNTYTVNNATLTIQKNGTNVATFTSNASANATANITVPTKTSELTNDSGFLTSHQSLSNYVTLNSAQTITATKTWTASQSFKNTAITNYKAAPSADTEIWACQFWSNDNKYWGGLGHKYLTTGFSEVQLCMSNWTTSGSQGYWHLDFGAAKDFSSVYFRPSGNNNCYLGTSDKKWANVYATTFTGNLTGNVTGNVSGTAANVTGTVAIANGGTGATSRLNAVKNLTNENVGTGTQYFLTITSNWGKAGYCSVADAKTVLGLGSAAYTASTAYAAASHTHTKSQITDFPTKVSAFTNDSGYLTSHQSLANYVTLNGTQTISGVKSISTNLKFVLSGTRGTAPSATTHRRPVDMVDSAGNRVFLITTAYNTNMSSMTELMAYNTTVASGNSVGSIGIGCDSSGNCYTKAPTPATTDNSTKIATTAFVNSFGNSKYMAKYTSGALSVGLCVPCKFTISIGTKSGSTYSLATGATVSGQGLYPLIFELGTGSFELLLVTTSTAAYGGTWMYHGPTLSSTDSGKVYIGTFVLTAM